MIRRGAASTLRQRVHESLLLADDEVDGLVRVALAAERQPYAVAEPAAHGVRRRPDLLRAAEDVGLAVRDRNLYHALRGVAARGRRGARVQAERGVRDLRARVGV